MTTIGTLAPGDFAIFDRFGIDAALLADAQVRRVSHQEARDLCGIVYRSDHLEGIWYPALDPENGQIRGGRVRRDHPELESDGSQKAKYVAPPQRHPLYFPPDSRGRLNDPAVVVVLVEAEKSALCVMAAAARLGRRVLAIALGGCWGWRGVVGKTTDAHGVRVDVKGPVPDFDRLTWTGRAAVILFDANAQSNGSVQAARRGLAQDLARRGAHVRLAELPASAAINGPDDYRAQHGDAALLAVIDQAPTAAPPKPKKEPQGRALTLDDPEPWPDPVDGATLLADLRSIVQKYVALPPASATAIALWTLHAYLMAAWFLSPVLAITSPVMRCGKTMLLIVLGVVTPRRLYASHITAAGLFRTIEKFRPTLFIDEADTFLNGQHDELRGILNSGHTRTTAVVIRPVGDDHDPRVFSTWCAKAIALIGKLPATLSDRAIEVPMRRRMPGEQVERLRQDTIDAEGADLRRQAARWAADHAARITAIDPIVPATLHDRAADCWRPLLAIADAVGGDWPTEARAAAVALAGDARDDLDLATELLQDIQTILEDAAHVLDAEDPAATTTIAAIKTETLLGQLHDMTDRPWPTFGKTEKPLTSHRLARLLKPFQIASAGKLRFPDGTRARAYRIDAFGEAFARYLPFKVGKWANANKTGPELDISKWADENSRPTSKNADSSMNSGLRPTCPLWEGDLDDRPSADDRSGPKNETPKRERSDL